MKEFIKQNWFKLVVALVIAFSVIVLSIYLIIESQKTLNASSNDVVNSVKDIAQLNLGYLTICVTVILFLGATAIGFFGFFSIKPIIEKLNKQEDETKKQSEDIKKIQNGIEDKTKSLVENSKKELKKISEEASINHEDRISKIEVEFKAESARILAYAIGDSGLPYARFLWSITAANYYKKSLGSIELTEAMVDWAEQSIKKITWGKPAQDFLEKNILDIRSFFNELRPTYEVRVKRMEKIFEEGMFGEKKATVPLPLS